jgi:tripartite-type tricarboxylate transporter receptor subunit TctC
LLVTTGVSVLAIVPQTTELPYTGPEDFSHIICVASTPIVLAVQATAPYKSIKEFLDASRSSPNKVRVATSGTGASNNIEAHRLNRAGNAGFLIVPYTGGGEPIAALLGGHVDATVDTPLTLYPHAQAGKLRILAVFGPARIPSAPEVPTLVESGIDLVSSVYYSITGPKGMQPEVVKVLHDAFKKGMEEEVFTRFLRNSHLQSMYLSGKDTHARLRSDFEVYGKVLDQIGIKKK